jgi:hypothetical protein
MEVELGTLSSKALDLRTLVDFCCIWRYDYPGIIVRICEAVGATGPVFARCHYQVDSKRRSVLVAYASAMKGWLSGQSLEAAAGALDKEHSPVVETVYRLLGTRDDIKVLLVERSLLGLASRSIDCSYWGKADEDNSVSLSPYRAAELPDDWRTRMRTLHEEIYQRLGSGGIDFLCEVGGTEPACHFKFLRRLEILLSSIGCLRWRGAVPPKDSRVSGRRQLTGHYLDALRAYWDEVPSRDRHHKDKEWKATEERIFSALGDIDTLKQWLVASLWKNIKDQTEYQSYTMRRWVEFVQIGGEYVRTLFSPSKRR